MSAFANLPISRKLTAAFAAVVAVIFASGVIVYDRLGVIEDAKNWRIHTIDVLASLDATMHAMLDQETNLRGYLITGDQSFLEAYRRGGDAFTAALRRTKELAADEAAQQSRLDELNELTTKWRSEVPEREIAFRAKSETREDGHALEGSRAGETVMGLVRAKVNEIATVERDLLAMRIAVHNQAYATAYTVTVLGGAGSLIVAMLMGVLLTRGITVPIKRMTNAMAALAKGDTTVEVPGVGRRDEIGAMAAAVQVFKDSIIERQRAQAELAHANRIATMGQLTASIAHEVKQPIVGVVTSGNAGLRWLAAEPPNVSAARRALERIVRDGHRAAEVIDRIRALVKKAPLQKEIVEINAIITETLALTRAEALRNGIVVQSKLATDLPLVAADRIQLQQVILNLIVNAVEAMSDAGPQGRELLVVSGKDSPNRALVAVRDSGPGLRPEDLDRLFDAFYTTKPRGMGMGLAISRTIIESHGGRLWATPNLPQGTVFQFTLPIDSEVATSSN